jgi:hypothetical protein
VSAWIVPAKTMDDCVLAFLTVGLIGNTPEEKAKLAEALYDLNHEAVRQRYGEAEEREPYTYTLRAVSMTQMYKSLCCLHYQCSEGDCDEHETYRRIERCLADLAQKIVTALPTWETDVWVYRD